MWMTVDHGLGMAGDSPQVGFEMCERSIAERSKVIIIFVHRERSSRYPSNTQDLLQLRVSKCSCHGFVIDAQRLTVCST